MYDGVVYVWDGVWGCAASVGSCTGSFCFQRPEIVEHSWKSQHAATTMAEATYLPTAVAVLHRQQTLGNAAAMT